VNELSASLVLLVTAVGGRPLACHDGRLTAILSVPDSIERMIKRLDAYDSSLYNRRLIALRFYVPPDTE